MSWNVHVKSQSDIWGIYGRCHQAKREYLMGYITNHMIPAFPVDDVMGTVGEMAKWDMGYMSPPEELLCFMGKIWENNDQQ